MRKRIFGLWPGFVLMIFFSACSKSGRSLTAELKNADGSKTVSLQFCPTSKCLTVYVAPWCGVCRASTGLIQAFRGYLAEHGVASRVVVGMDDPEAVRAYAQAFGPDTLLDPEGLVDLQSGVPNFIVSNSSGKVLKTMAGVPGIYDPPYPDSLMREFAEYLGLAR